jgi:hypothetical protein
LVTSIRVGAVEKVPYARNCPVPYKLSVVSVVGTTAIESRGSGAAASVTVPVAVDETTVVSGFCTSAVIVVLPWLTPVMTPLPDASPDVMVAIDGMLDFHVVCGELVTSTSKPVVPDVASAMNCPVWPESEIDCEDGTMVTDVYFSVDPFDTLKLPVPAIVLPPLV